MNAQSPIVRIESGFTRRDDPWAEFRRSYDRRRFMTRRFVRRGASYGEAIRAAHALFPLAPMPSLKQRYPFGEAA